MTRTAYIEEIIGNINSLDSVQLNEISKFVKYIKYQEFVEPTLEIVSNKLWMKEIKKGLKESANDEVVNWDSIK